MSKINIKDVELYFEGEDEIKGINKEARARRKQGTRIRRKVEYLVEQKNLKEMSYTEDSYWGNEV